jgi:RloB-like protein
MRPRRQQGKSLKRVAGKRSELRTIVVFCEGKNSEPDYINGLKKLSNVAENVALNIEIHPKQGVPLTLVEMAVDRKSRDSEVDQCWCIFDVEWPKNHPNLPQAIDLARAHNIKLAISNPCFEVWLIMHVKHHAKFLDTDTAEKNSRALDKRPGKSIDADFYMPLRKEASRRARLLDKRHTDADTLFPNNNPSSGMYKFIDEVERPLKPQ